MFGKNQRIRLQWSICITALVVLGMSRVGEAQIGNNGYQYLRNQPTIQGLTSLIEPGQLADTLSLWGDVGLHGRVLVPRNMSLVELISYAGGPGASTTSGGRYNVGQQLNWSHQKVYLRINRYDPAQKKFHLRTFTFQYNHPLPQALENFDLHNNDVINVLVRTKPSPLDYIQVFGITIGSIAAIVLVAGRLGAF